MSNGCKNILVVQRE